MLIDVKSKIGGARFDATPQEPLLYAALKAGIPFPYECATGTCGTCKARRLSGVVAGDWPEAPGTAFLRPDGGEVLMCQTHALTDCSFEIAGNGDLGKIAVAKPSFGEAVIERVERLTADVVMLQLHTEQPLEFDAGQFIVLRAEGVQGYRAYSMANLAQPTNKPEFIIKLKPNGNLTPRLCSPTAVGGRVTWFGPLGRATFRPQEQRTIVCLAGGSGMSSILSILETGCASRHFDHFDGAVFFGVRTEADVFYLDRLSRHAEEFPNGLKITIALSDAAPSDRLKRAHPALAFEAGFPHEIAAQQLAGRFAGRVAYVAGPPVMVDVSIRMLITKARLPARDIRYDKFN